MKLKGIIAMCFLLSFANWGFGQGVDIVEQNLEFYRQMALNDAHMEEDLVFSSEEDEADYWKDQFRFEKELKEKEYSAYKNYIHYKRIAYLEHQSECDIAENHGNGYLAQANFYASQGNGVKELLGKN